NSAIANQARCFRIATLHDHSIAVADAGMTRCAVNVVALLAAIEHSLRDRKRKPIPLLHAGLARVVVGVCAQLPTGNSPRDLQARSHSIRPKCAAAKRDVFWLIMHILAAADAEEQQSCNTQSSHQFRLCHANVNSAPPLPHEVRAAPETTGSLPGRTSDQQLQCTERIFLCLPGQNSVN